MSLPPGPRQPAIAQMLQFSLRPLPFLEECARRCGDPFTMRLPGLGTYVLIAAPELIKQVFTAPTEELLAGKANTIVEPIVGKKSVLLLDGKEHLRQRRLLSPPLHGERMQNYAALMTEITEAALRRMPLERPFALHEYMQRITLQVILRAVFGLDEGARMHDLERLLVEWMRPPPAFVTFIPVKYLDFPLSPVRTFFRRRDKIDVELRAIIRARQAAPLGPRPRAGGLVPL